MGSRRAYCIAMTAQLKLAIEALGWFVWSKIGCLCTMVLGESLPSGLAVKSVLRWVGHEGTQWAATEDTQRITVQRSNYSGTLS